MKNLKVASSKFIGSSEFRHKRIETSLLDLATYYFYLLGFLLALKYSHITSKVSSLLSLSDHLCTKSIHAIQQQNCRLQLKRNDYFLKTFSKSQWDLITLNKQLFFSLSLITKVVLCWLKLIIIPLDKKQTATYRYIEYTEPNFKLYIILNEKQTSSVNINIRYCKSL